METEQHIGVIQAFIKDQGYGFLQTEDGDVLRIFSDDILGDGDGLTKGEVVSFKINIEDSEKKAYDIERKILYGRVKRYGPHDFGFITRDDGKGDIFVHAKSLKNARYLEVDDKVQFVEGINDRGYIALEVICLNIDTDNEQNDSTNESRITYNDIYRIAISGFKSFGSISEFDLKDITIFSGLNSKGKSSLIDALLLLKQTLMFNEKIDERVVLKWKNDPGQALPFYVDKYEEMVFGKQKNCPFKIVFEIKYTTIASCIFAFTFKMETIYGKDLLIVEITMISSGLKNGIVKKHRLDLMEYRYDENVSKVIVKYSGDDDYLPQMEEMDITENVNFRHFIPIWNQAHPSESEYMNEAGEILPEYKIAKKRFNYYKLYRDMFEPGLKIFEKKILSIKYLGPLRSEPKRIYKYATVDEIGLSGEHSMLKLHENWNKKIEFIDLPKSPDEKIMWENLSIVEMDLSEAVNSSLQWLGMQQLNLIGSEETGVIKAEFRAKDKGSTSITIADVGFGVSQILPVITQGLMSKQSDILIFEQPEIHLHPRAQAKLAELFLCFVFLGKKIIVESHSDHLINRFRLLIAEDMSDELTEKVNIVFVQQDHEGNSFIDNLKLTSEGQIENWPDEFLAETAEESRAILKATLLKRKG